MNPLVNELLQSPELPQIAEQLNRYLAEEHQRRLEFYENMSPDEKVEFINGEVIHNSPAINRHTFIVKNLMKVLDTYVVIHTLGVVRTEKALVSLTRNDFEPDVAFWAIEKAQHFTEELMHFPAPDWVAEVLSPSTAKRDRGVKLQDYALHGCKEYWIVDGAENAIEQYLLAGDAYTLAGTYHKGAKLESRAVQGFTLDPIALFDEAANLLALQYLLQR